MNSQERWFSLVSTLLVSGLLLFGQAELPAELVPELIVVNAQVITMDPDRPQAGGFAVTGDEFVAVGDAAAMRELARPETRVFDAGGKTILPGFNDAHMHPDPLYDELSPFGQADISPASVRTIEELVERLRRKAAATPAGLWVRGGRYEDTKLGRHPTRHDLDRASRDHPIVIRHSSGHLSVVNSKALELAGVSAATIDPKGGAFDRDEHGAPNGVCRESAAGIVTLAGPPLPEASREEQVAGLLRRFEQFAAEGLTSVTDAGCGLDKFELYRLAQERGLAVRVCVMFRERQLEQAVAKGWTMGAGDDRLRVGGIKSFHGNSLSGRTCWLYEPYADRLDYHGIPPARNQQQLDDLVRKVHNAGFQAAIHSNGDREIDMVLAAYERVLQESPRANHRHRIEHCSVANAEILRRAKALGLVLTLHSYIYEHGDTMEAYGSRRWPMMHPNRSALELGIPVAGNSDYPVSAARPLLRLQDLTTRTTAGGRVYGPEQRISLEQALWTFTVGSAYASFDENRKGAIKPKLLADFVVLSADPRGTPPNELGKLQVEQTWIGGRQVHPPPATP